MKAPLTCDATRNRLLAEPNPARVPSDLRGHVDDCSACKEFLVRFVELNRDLKTLPVPCSEVKKLEFQQMLESAGPIIRSIPSSASTTLIPWKSLWLSAAKPLAYTAACVAFGVGVWSLVPGKRGTVDVATPRHELLKNIVNHNTALAKATTPQARLETLTGLMTDLETEAGRVAVAASPEELAALATMFEKVVTNGVVKQGKDMNVFTPNRKDLIKAAADKLATTADNVSLLVDKSPTISQPALKRMKDTATKARFELTLIANGTGA